VELGQVLGHASQKRSDRGSPSFFPGSYSAYLQLGRARPWARERLKGIDVRCDVRWGRVKRVPCETSHTQHTHIHTHTDTHLHGRTYTHTHICGTSGRWLKSWRGG
jgi:hypothetical protein